jgi:hypothetical protein
LADTAFPAERLAAQHRQILRRLAQLDQPKRIIAFPNSYRLGNATAVGRRVALGWVGAAAAAGIVVGLLGGRIASRLGQEAERTGLPAGLASASIVEPSAGGRLGASRLDQLDHEDLDHFPIRSLDAIDEMIPRTISGSDVVLASLPTRAPGGSR